MSPQEMTTKKALVVVGSLVALAMLTLVIPAKYVGVKPVKRQALVLQKQEDFSTLQKDADNNGVPDWKDLLNRTMSTSTKEAATKQAISVEDKQRLNDPNNLTSSFSKNIYLASAYATEKGNMTASEQDALAARIIQDESAKLTFKSYDVSELTLTKEETDASRKAYINALGVVYLKALAAKLTAGDVNTLKSFKEKTDPAIIQSLIVKKNILETIISDLVKVKVPYSAAPYHLLIINSLSKYKSVLENIAKANEDPIRATLAVNAYGSTIQELYSAITSLQPYIAIENITLTNSDPGYILISGGGNK